MVAVRSMTTVLARPVEEGRVGLGWAGKVKTK
jgi:hypothetical protein